MNAFTELLKGWESFFLAVATAAATLMGLLFVALSVNLHLLRGRDGGHHRDTAVRTFGDFLFTLMLSLVLLVPNQEPIGLAIALFVLGLVRGVSLVRQALKARSVTKNQPSTSLVVRDYALPLFATVGLLVVALRILYGHFGALILLVGVVSALLVTACQNAWSLLLQQSGGKE
jgi:hypothetical protein